MAKEITFQLPFAVFPSTGRDPVSWPPSPSEKLLKGFLFGAMINSVDLFNIMMNKREAPPKSICGVYLLFDNETVIYVGQSIDISNRVLTHVKEGVKKFQWYSFHECEIDQLDEMEAYFIWMFQPPLNVRIPINQQNYCVVFTYLKRFEIDGRKNRKKVQAVRNQKRFWSISELHEIFNQSSNSSQ